MANYTKNVTHNDHAYNAVDRIRRKLQEKADDGGIGSKDWSVTTTTKTIAENVDGVVADDATECQFNVHVNEEPIDKPLSKIKLSADISFTVGHNEQTNHVEPQFVWSVSDSAYKIILSDAIAAYDFMIKSVGFDDQGCYITFYAKPFVVGATVTMLSASNCTVEYEDTDVTISEDFAKVLQYAVETLK